MKPLAYRAGRLAAQHTLGLEKTATTTAAISQHLKKLIPKTTLGKGLAIGGLAGIGMGAHMLLDDRRQPGTAMKTPYINTAHPLMYEPQY